MRPVLNSLLYLLLIAAVFALLLFAYWLFGAFLMMEGTVGAAFLAIVPFIMVIAGILWIMRWMSK